MQVLGLMVRGCTAVVRQCHRSHESRIARHAHSLGVASSPGNTSAALRPRSGLPPTRSDSISSARHFQSQCCTFSTAKRLQSVASMLPPVNGAGASATIPCIIDNKAYHGATQATFDVVDPADRKTVMHKAAALQINDLGALMTSSSQGLQTWRNTPIAERRRIFTKTAQLLQERLPQLIDVESHETTASAGFAGYELAVLTTSALEETAAAMSAALRGEMAPFDPSGKRMAVTREPLGVVLSMVPWNAPSTLCMRAIINPLAAGCSVILKTSEYSPKIHGEIAKLFYDAGLPAGVLNTINVATQDAPVVVKAIIEHPVVRKVNFTGSTRVGRSIAQVCAGALKPVVLELGGKAPVVVTDDADLDLAANNVVVGGLMNQGQICMSSANIIVQKDVLPALQSKVAAIMEQNRALLQAGSKRNQPGGPEASDHRLRALFTAPASERVKGLYEEAMAAGAKLIAGQPGFDTDLGLVQPVFLQGTPQMRIFGEEAFAPIIGMYPYETDEEATVLANAPGAGLSASVFSRNESRAWAIAQKIESGAVHINGMTVHDDQNVPHGGTKTSGYGRFNGVEGIREYTLQKTITITPGIQYPYFIL